MTVIYTPDRSQRECTVRLTTDVLEGARDGEPTAILQSGHTISIGTWGWYRVINASSVERQAFRAAGYPC